MTMTLTKSSLALAVSLASVSAVGQTANADNTEQAHSLNKVIVTGQKMERSLQDTKESIVVLTAKDLESRSLYELSDVLKQTPGVTGDQFGFRIRGVRSSDGASQPNRGDLASVVIDGVTLSGWVKSEAAGQLWDVSQVEVLRGPQSTNLGRNALAGAVVVNTQDPVYNNEGKIRVGFGNYGQREYKGVANVNLVDGVSALRFAYEQTDSDGYIDNKTRNEKDFGGDKNEVYRLKWLLEPSDDLSMVLSYQRLENNFGDTKVLLGKYDADDRVSLSNTKGKFETRADVASVKVDYQINDVWSLKSISAYQDGERDRLSDTDQGPASYGNGGGTVTRFSEDNNWSQELRFNFDSGNVRGSTGVYYTNLEAKRNQDIRNDLNLPTLFDTFAKQQGIDPNLVGMLFQPIPGLTTEPLYPKFFGEEQNGSTDVDTTSWAVFSEWEIDFAEKWTASVGARYDNEKQKYVTASTTETRGTLPAQLTVPPAAHPAYATVLTVNGIIQQANAALQSYARSVPRTTETKKFDNLLPHAGISYHWNDDTTGSFFVKKSYRSGGSELTLHDGINEFDEEELWNYEFALRSVLFDGSGVFNTNLYYSDWTDQQVSVLEPGAPNPAFTKTVNAGKSKLYGIELSFEYDINEVLSMYASGAFNKTEYTTFTSADGKQNYSGNEFTFAPKETAVLGVNYQSGNGVFVNTSANYAGESYSDVDNKNKLTARTLLDINGGYELNNLKLELFVKNVFDRTYETNNSLATPDGTPSVLLGAPRTYGARATYAF